MVSNRDIIRTPRSPIRRFEINDLINNLNENNFIDYNILNERPIENSELSPLINKLVDLEAKISNLKTQIRIETEAASMLLERARRSEEYIKNIQEILFENNESIPEWLYIKLMNSLIGK